MPKMIQPPFQQECAEVRESKDPVGKTDISGGELNAALDVGILFAADQCGKRFGTFVSGLDLHGQKFVCGSNKEVLLQLGIFALIISLRKRSVCLCLTNLQELGRTTGVFIASPSEV
jgi:hypothetical protein